VSAFQIPTVYARREVTTDSATKDMLKAQGRPGGITRFFDVQIYHDKAGKRPFGRFVLASSNRPTRRNKYVALNCFRYRLEWIN
jgi:hypothetical protein